ncbi:hypothetical protein DN752_12210 [Echinicola strongylocentroti]|uniref:DUF4382 domain-containing protein n=1 Tax=Echinicola strongylocentroti TaxID=1795355 RepID=A0A2Z4IJW7_9BACT|nr:hypothetical protein [Echinicola strongylocentroti]AWW30826.1 hypothetical protein DN752_12210 [Echinicola strongylocentroti]
MNTKFRWVMVACCCFAISAASFGQEENASTKYYLNVTSEKNGIKEDISKTYDGRAVLEKDAFFKSLDIDLPSGSYDKLILETTVNEKKVSLSTVNPLSTSNKNIAGAQQDEEVHVELFKGGKSVKVVRGKPLEFDRPYAVGNPTRQSGLAFLAEETNGGNTRMYSQEREVEIFAFDKDENGQLQINDAEADKTIERLERLIDELKAAKKHNH